MDFWGTSVMEKIENHLEYIYTNRSEILCIDEQKAIPFDLASRGRVERSKVSLAFE